MAKEVPSVECLVDIKQLASYLVKVLTPLLDSTKRVPVITLQQSILKDNEDVKAKLQKFIECYQEHTLSVLYRLPLEDSDSSSDLTPFCLPTFDIHLGVHYCTQRCVGVIFSKRGVVIVSDKPIQTQLRFLMISEESPFETIHSYIDYTISPYFNLIVEQSCREKR